MRRAFERKKRDFFFQIYIALNITDIIFIILYIFIIIENFIVKLHLEHTDLLYSFTVFRKFSVEIFFLKSVKILVDFMNFFFSFLHKLSKHPILMYLMRSETQINKLV